MKEYEIDGLRFSHLDGFYDEIDRVLQPGSWGRNLDAFNDILRGGFGTPDEGFALRWKNHEVSRERLGYQETVRVPERRSKTCHPASVTSVEEQLEEARLNRGSTVFDWLVREPE
jgi:RNAse (barnase) inhibitor barstar